jgi:PIN domain nuclease of toxin-antitoxin system
MRVLLDTHAFLWWIDDSPQLSDRARATIAEGSNDLFLSAASGWEIAIKAQLGKIRVQGELDAFMAAQLHQNNISVLSIQLAHALHVASLPLLHRDPFDRLLVAQGRLEDMPILTADPLMQQYDIVTLW